MYAIIMPKDIIFKRKTNNPIIIAEIEKVVDSPQGIKILIKSDNKSICFIDWDN